MDYITAYKKVIKKMEANPTIPDEALDQLVQEKFLGKKSKEIINKYAADNYEINEFEEEDVYAPYPREEITDHDLELEVENRQYDEL